MIDTSILLAILRNDPEAPRFAEAIADDPKRVISAATLLEAVGALD
jgi:ribonuclease VapC